MVLPKTISASAPRLADFRDMYPYHTYSDDSVTLALVSAYDIVPRYFNASVGEISGGIVGTDGLDALVDAQIQYYILRMARILLSDPLANQESVGGTVLSGPTQSAAYKALLHEIVFGPRSEGIIA
jgi:hypothetical protein